MSFLFFLTVAFCGFLLTFAAIAGYIRYAHKKDWLDHPNHRSAHVIPTPRGGGIIFVSFWLVILVIGTILHWFPFHYALIFFPGALIVALTGYLDDHFDLPHDWRLFAYMLAAIWGIAILKGWPNLNIGMHILPLPFIGTVLALIAIIWSTNLFNFMDGADGFAGLEAIFVFSIGGYLLWHAGGYDLAYLAWILSALMAGFLIWNWPPAKLFMGDVGSVFLGYLVAEFALVGERYYGVPALLWLMLYTVFYFDATVTLVRRMIAGEKWYQAHRLHAFQRLTQSGFSKRQLLAGLSAVNMIFVVLVLFANYYRAWLPVFFIISLIIGYVIYAIIERRIPMFSR